MTTVQGYLQHYSRKVAFADYRESFELMIEELDRANIIITNFLSLAKNQMITMISTDLNKVISKIFPLLQVDALRRGNTIELDLQEIPEILADDKEIRQCILNLVVNGLDAMPKGGTLKINTARTEDRVIMTVQDQGTGIAPEIRKDLWIPFFTTKEHGTGLGLSICYRIAQRHQATFEVETSSKGTAFHLIFNQDKITN